MNFLNKGKKEEKIEAKKKAPARHLKMRRASQPKNKDGSGYKWN